MTRRGKPGITVYPCHDRFGIRQQACPASRYPGGLPGWSESRLAEIAFRKPPIGLGYMPLSRPVGERQKP